MGSPDSSNWGRNAWGISSPPLLTGARIIWLCEPLKSRENGKILLNNSSGCFSCLKCPSNSIWRLFLVFHTVVSEKFAVSVFVLY